MASGILISAFGPEASEGQVMQYMQGMMSAMHSSLMGLSMSIEQDADLQRVIYNASAITIPLIFAGAALGLYIRFSRGKGRVRQ